MSNVNDFFVPEILADSIRAGLAGVTALYGTGAVRIEMGMGSQKAGTKVTVPYFSALSPAEVITSADDDTEAAVDGISSEKEEATVYQARKVVDATEWSRMSQRPGDDPYVIMVQQALQVIERAIDQSLLDQAYDETRVLVHDGGTNLLDYDMVVDAHSLLGDELENIALMSVHSKTLATLRKLKGTDGRPLLVEPASPDIRLRYFAGVPVMTSDRLGIQAGTWGAVTPTGGGPTLTLSGTPKNNYSLVVEITLAGTRGNAKFRYSLNGGKTWTKNILTAATYLMPGTGTTLEFASGSYTTSHSYAAAVDATQYRSIICKRDSMVAWINSSPVVMEDVNVSKPSRIAGIHTWFAPHVYRNMPDKTLPGVVLIKHGITPPAP
jgi:hypothetical protein